MEKNNEVYLEVISVNGAFMVSITDENSGVSHLMKPVFHDYTQAQSYLQEIDTLIMQIVNNKINSKLVICDN